MALCACRQCTNHRILHKRGLLGRVVSPRSSRAEAVTPRNPDVTVFADGVLKESLLLGWALIHSNRFPQEEVWTRTEERPPEDEGEDTSAGQRAASEGASAAPDLGPPDAGLGGSTLLLFKPPHPTLERSPSTLIQEASRKQEQG